MTTGCNQPGGSTTDFSSPCLNDDISASPHVQDSALDYTAPSSARLRRPFWSTSWTGAETLRPDMQLQRCKSPGRSTLFSLCSWAASTFACVREQAMFCRLRITVKRRRAADHVQRYPPGTSAAGSRSHRATCILRQRPRRPVLTISPFTAADSGEPDRQLSRTRITVVPPHWRCVTYVPAVGDRECRHNGAASGDRRRRSLLLGH